MPGELAEVLEKQEGISEEPPAQMTGFGCANISVQPESLTRNLGVPPLYIGGAYRLGKKDLGHGFQVGSNQHLKSTPPNGMLGVWCTSRD